MSKAAVAVFDVLAGSDPADPYTTEADERRADNYNDYLDADALNGARLGVVRQISDRESGDPRVLERFEEALADLRASGAEIADPTHIPMLDERHPPVQTCQRRCRYCNR